MTEYTKVESQLRQWKGDRAELDRKIALAEHWLAEQENKISISKATKNVKNKIRNNV